MMNDHPKRCYRIFALDRQPLVTAGISHILADYAVCTANKTQQMTVLLRQGEMFDLFILDLELPDADGFQALKLIRQTVPTAPSSSAPCTRDPGSLHAWPVSTSRALSRSPSPWHGSAKRSRPSAAD